MVLFAPEGAFHGFIYYLNKGYLQGNTIVVFTTCTSIDKRTSDK